MNTTTEKALLVDHIKVLEEELKRLQEHHLSVIKSLNKEMSRYKYHYNMEWCKIHGKHYDEEFSE